MNSWNRVGTGLFGLAGLILAGLMTYTLLFTGWRSLAKVARPDDARDSPVARVAIFLPGRRDWADFRQAVAACRIKNLVRILSDREDRLVVESAKTGRQIQFERQGVRGLSDTREEVRRLARSTPVPVAVVGSTTSVLTVAIAEALRESGRSGPLLAIPWATAVMARRSTEPRGEPVPFIEIDPGRTWRFCPNNRRLADSVVDCLVARDEGRLPGRVFLVVDPFDPYSDDMASCLRQAIRARKPDVEIVERADAVDLPSFARPLDASPEPSPTENQLADAIVSSQEGGDLRPTWVVLPLQDHPARRLIAALRRRSAWQSAAVRPRGPLRVVCGDAIEREALGELAGQGGLSIWCASTSSSTSSGLGINDDTQALAEIASAMVWAVDHVADAAADPDQVQAIWHQIDLGADDPAAFGRRLAFEPNGERRGDPGRVLVIQPDASMPVEYARSPDGSWQPIGAATPVHAP